MSTIIGREPTMAKNIESRPTGLTATRAPSVTVQWTQLRTSSDDLAVQVRSGHERSRAADLDERTNRKATNHDVTGLLDELSNGRGMSWASIATAISVSQSAIRKWRQGGASTPENRMSLSRLAAFLDTLSEKFVPDPAQWLEVRFALPDGYRLRPLDIYATDGAVVLLDLVEDRLRPEDVLDSVRPDWREERSDYEVFTAEDGERSLRPRGV